MAFDVEIECPHCDCEFTDVVSFDEGEFDREGTPVEMFDRTCEECGKKFWFEAQVRFETEVYAVFDKKPKAKGSKK